MRKKRDRRWVAAQPRFRKRRWQRRLEAEFGFPVPHGTREPDVIIKGLL